MRSSEVRSSFLEFFARHDHRIVPSSSLVPADDPTLLFTNAGMNQFKDVFLGKEHRDYTRAASSQKCMRVSGKHNDLENVGPSLRHHTFFEMLGNFSFGDYFKADAIALAWTLLTEEWKLPVDRLHATIFGGEGAVPRDEEAGRVWRQFLPPDRIGELGLADNFWSMGDTGPCGRCSEIHYFRGADIPCPEPVCLGVACSCDRFVEVWNNVFMEFDRHANGSLAPLPAPSIDTGMGLERVTAVLEGVLSNYDTDLFTPLLGALGDLAHVHYGGAMSPGDVSMRVVADHTRAMTFLIADGVVPSNEWRGYVLRKIMRRAMRHGKRLGMTEPFLFKLVGVLAHEMGDAYAELQRQRAFIEQVVHSEEERFESVLVSGLPRLEEVLERAVAAGRGVVPGDEAFRLYDTYGVPRDFIEDLASERHLALDLEGFERAMEGQREKARAQSAFGSAKAESLVLAAEEAGRLRAAGDHFEGYTSTRLAGVPLVAILDEHGRAVPELGEGLTGYLALARTPFYAESGGQVSDSGRIFTETGSGDAAVEAIVRLAPDQARLHRVRVTTGVLRGRDLVTAEVNRDLRDATRRNHTATHLLHAALRRVLGRHVKQAGSLVAPDRLRFDFLHFAAVSRDALDQIEQLVNEQIGLNIPLETEVRATEEAIAAGAMALFGEKYGDHVRVVSVPGFSLELCGGTHCRSTGDIGFLTIIQESGIAAGTRRIEALTGPAAVRHHQQQRGALAGILQTLNTPVDQAVEVIEHLEAEVKRLGRENSQLKVKLAMGRSAPGAADSFDASKAGLGPAGESIGGIRVHIEQVDGLDKASLRSLADSHRDRLKSGIVVLASADAGKVAVVVSVTKDLTNRVHSGEIVKLIAPIVGGGGGGRPDFAEAGGRNPERIGELLDESRRALRRALEP